MTLSLSSASLAMAALMLSAPLAMASNFGCSGQEFNPALPSIEGKDGYFYRVFADLRLQHEMTDPVIERLGALSDALAAQGTTLVYVTVPTKSQAMPQYLPDHAAEYGFDIAIATKVYQNIITRLTARGVTAPDLQTAMSKSDDAHPVFFQADFHWTSDGARLAAEAIGAAIRATPAFAELTPEEYTSTPAKETAAFSGMRRALQGFCTDELPRVETMAYVTAKAEETLDLGTDIFASDAERPEIALVGTSFSDSTVNNFAGFISQYSGLDLVNYAITGGNQFGSITSYMTSRAFQEARPQYLIWENPIYNGLVQYGFDPLDELIAAAGDTCTQVLPATKADANTVSADLKDITLQPGDLILADFGKDESRNAQFSFATDSGVVRTATMARADRLAPTGRFFQTVSAIWRPDFTKVDVRFDRAVTDETTLTLCTTAKKDAS